eukprot:7952642-Pyramimonas_sp.AAC.1
MHTSSYAIELITTIRNAGAGRKPLLSPNRAPGRTRSARRAANYGRAQGTARVPPKPDLLLVSAS